MRTLLLLLPLAILSAQTPKTNTSRRVAAKAPAAKTTALKQDYKESGSPSAPITVYAYTDYECPHCARFYQEFMPQFTKDYIQTGKIRFIHRDFPLPQHQHAVMAAKYADAAGEVGYYDVAVQQIFKTQTTWGASENGPGNGNLDAELTKVIPPGAMQKIRELVKTTGPIDASIAKDVSDAQNVDHVMSTPTIVIVTRSGKREPVSTVMETPYPIFKKYLDAKIAGR